MYFYSGERCGGCNVWGLNYSSITSPLVLPRKSKLGIELWRFFTYQFLHNGIQHLFTNCVLQLFFGIPLEMVHGWIRISGIYITGVIIGGCTDLLITPNIPLVGASGGVWALIMAYTANIFLNFDIMSRWGKLVRIAVIVACFGGDMGRVSRRTFKSA